MSEHARLHALDNLRAIMMWLGIVLHAAVIYTVAPGFFPFHDRQSTIGADLMLLFIHSFRMAVFFILAGYFASLLAARDGASAMLRHRLRRIGLPFVIFWPLLFAATVLATMLFVHVIERGTLGIDPTLMKAPADDPLTSTIHLWFLYYLLIFCSIAAGIARIGKPVSGHAADLAARIGVAWWGCLPLALPAAIFGFSHTAGIVPNRTSFMPYPDELIHNGVYFTFGWFLYARRDVLLAHYRQHCWRYLSAGIVLFVLYLGMVGRYRTLPMPLGTSIGAAFAYGCLAWLLGFALIGLFARYLGTPRPVLGYLARSSYWVYLLHFPVIVAIGALLYRFDLGAPLKMAINVAATTAIGLLTYHLLVRGSVLGRLLNGTPRAPRAQPGNMPVLH